jgi:predicted secreted protein
MITNAGFKLVRGLAMAAGLLFPVIVSATEPVATVTLAAKDASQPVEVKVGDTLEIRLSAQLGTGYSWHLEAKDVTVLAPEGEPKTETRTDTLPGGAEIQVFRFTAKVPGKADLKFRYFRGFEPGKKPLRSTVFHIKVSAPKS